MLVLLFADNVCEVQTLGGTELLEVALILKYSSGLNSAQSIVLMPSTIECN